MLLFRGLAVWTKVGAGDSVAKCPILSHFRPTGPDTGAERCDITWKLLSSSCPSQNGYRWISVDIAGYQWISMDIDGYGFRRLFACPPSLYCLGTGHSISACTPSGRDRARKCSARRPCDQLPPPRHGTTLPVGCMPAFWDASVAHVSTGKSTPAIFGGVFGPILALSACRKSADLGS